METQHSISEWAEATFGPASSDVRVLVRALEEFTEALRCFSAGDEGPQCREELADTWIVLCRLAERLGVDLRDGKETRPAYFLPGRVAGHILERLAAAYGQLTADAEFQAAMGWYGAPASVQAAGALLRDLAARMGFDLQAEVDRKMTVNRLHRKWNLTAGHGYHVRAKEDSDAETD